ncbi:MAG: hypothetical protein WCR42_14680 [bacterium]
MKTNYLIIASCILFFLFGVKSHCQEELKAPEKDEVVNRIKKDIQQYNEKWGPEVRKLLLNGDVEITKEEIDSLMIIITPTFKIKDNCIVKSDLMVFEIYDDDGISTENYYNYLIVPDSNKYTLYSSISDIYNKDKIENFTINVYTKEGKWRYTSWIPIGYDLTTKLHIMKYNPKFMKPEEYSKQYLIFYINSSKIDEKAKSKIRRYSPIKNEVCFIYNNRIYSGACLPDKFLTNDINEIFDNNPCSICNCDIDVYLRINEKADEVK